MGNSWKLSPRECKQSLEVAFAFFFLAKDKLFNDVISELDLQFPKNHHNINKDIDTVVSALWYLDGTANNIMDQANNNLSVKPVTKEIFYQIFVYIYLFIYLFIYSFIYLFISVFMNSLAKLLGDQAFLSL